MKHFFQNKINYLGVIWTQIECLWFQQLLLQLLLANQ